MPLARFEIEQIERNRWVAEVEVGGLIAKRRTVRGESFDDIMSAVIDAYQEINPPPVKPAEPVSAPAGEWVQMAPATEYPALGDDDDTFNSTLAELPKEQWVTTNLARTLPARDDPRFQRIASLMEAAGLDEAGLPYREMFAEAGFSEGEIAAMERNDQAEGFRFPARPVAPVAEPAVAGEKRPRGRRAAAEMRAAADRAAEARDPGLAERRAALAARRK